MDDLVTGNEIFETRTRGIGVIPAEVAQSYGLSGANLRASGVDWDLRRDGGYAGLVHDQLDWKVWTHPDGDSFARFWVRLQEIREATKIVDQCLDGLPAGPVMAKVPRIIKVPEGEAYVETENPLGAMGYYVISKGDLGPFRVKIRTPSFNNISIVPWVLRGVYVPDVITILAASTSSSGTSTGELDRWLARVDLAYWQQTDAAVRRRAASPCCCRPARFVYVFLFKIDQLHAEPARPERGRSLRLAAAARRGRQVPPEGGHRPERRPTARCSRWRPTSSSAPCCSSTPPCRSVPTPGSPTSTSASSTCSPSASVSVIGILIAGWASANKYSLIGGLRAAGQLIAYELPMVLAVVGVVIQAGTLNLQGIVVAQAEGEIFGFGALGNPFILTQFVGLFIFVIAMQAELTQTPFDMPVAESEIVTGYMTEYSGMRFLLFFIGEFASAGAFAAVAATLFLGGWYLPGLDLDADYMNVVGPLVAARQDDALRLRHLLGAVHLPPLPRGPAPAASPGCSSSRSRWSNILATGVLKVVF